VIVAAALCPAPPLLVRGVTGAQDVLPELRAACLAAVAEVVAAGPEVIAVAGAAGLTRRWDGRSRVDPSFWAPGLRRPAVPAADRLPGSLAVGAWLLAEAGYAGARVLQGIGPGEPAARCAEIGAELAAGAGRTGLLAMADGSARRALRAPGYLDDRAAGFDASVERIVRSGELGGLLGIDQELAAELMATGRPAWQALAGGLAGLRVAAEVRYCDAPFGVGYLVASLRAAGALPPGRDRVAR